MLKGYLRGKGLRVRWERSRQSLLRTDPSGGGSLFDGESTGFLDLLHCGTSMVIINSSGTSPKGGGGGLPCVGYTGMCHLTGYAFCISDSETGFNLNHPFPLEEGIFHFRFDSGTGLIFPRILVITTKGIRSYETSLPSSFACLHNHNRLKQCINFYIFHFTYCLEQGTYFANCVCRERGCKFIHRFLS